jgi:hypothetical protein
MIPFIDELANLHQQRFNVSFATYYQFKRSVASTTRFYNLTTLLQEGIEKHVNRDTETNLHEL